MVVEKIVKNCHIPYKKSREPVYNNLDVRNPLLVSHTFEFFGSFVSFEFWFVLFRVPFNLGLIPTYVVYILGIEVKEANLVSNNNCREANPVVGCCD